MSERNMLNRAFNNQSGSGMQIVLDNATKLAKHMADTEYRADHDALTGLLNKEAFKTILSERIIEARKNNRQLGIIFIDLKDFKQVNDKYGHEKGDEIIKKSANVVVNTVRTKQSEYPDIVSNEVLYYNSDPETGRLGGDEMAVILDLTAGTDKRDTNLTTAERLHSAQERIKNNFYLSGDIVETGVGISIGGAILKTNDTAESLLARADESMYKDKQEQIEQNGSYR